MDEHVAVAVRGKPALRRDLDARQHDVVLRFAEGVRVDAEARALAGGKVLGIGELFVAAVALKEMGRGDVGGIEAALVRESGELPLALRECKGVSEFAAPKALRGLHGKHHPARRHGGDGAVLCEHGGVRRGQRADAAAVFLYALDAGADGLLRHKGAGGIVDEHDIAPDFLESIPNALFTRLAAAHGAGPGEGGEERLDARLVLLPAGDEDLVRFPERRKAVRKHGQPVELAQYFIFGKARARARPRRAEDDGDHGSTS